MNNWGIPYKKPTVVVTIDPKTGRINRYEGHKRTHQAELTGPLNAGMISDILWFRNNPMAKEFIDPLPPGPMVA